LILQSDESKQKSEEKAKKSNQSGEETNFLLIAVYRTKIVLDYVQNIVERVQIKELHEYLLYVILGRSV
jgi:hypothetical protein